MAERPVFVPCEEAPFYRPVMTTFEFFNGFATTQKQKSIRSLHEAFLKEHDGKNILEISTKSLQEEGTRLSAFSLQKFVPSLNRSVPVECIFQASMVFVHGGPYTDLLTASPEDAKRNERLRTSDRLIAFRFEGTDYPITPETIFYDYIYMSALLENPDLAEAVLQYDAFTDIEFNPERSINCQAKTAAAYVSLYRKGFLEKIKDFNTFKELYPQRRSALSYVNNNLYDTLSILEEGNYELDGKQKSLKLTRAQMENIQVFLPEDIAAIKEAAFVNVPGQTLITCENTDSFCAAAKITASLPDDIPSKPVLVLNLANPVHPGGGVRRGSKAQEEDLCRRSSLLLSLESDTANKYYEYNRSLDTYMGSDAVMITPEVAVIKNEKNSLLSDTLIVSVMTCAAPYLKNGKEGMTEAEYQEMLKQRIIGMLKVSAHLGYDTLVLGAFGCGAFKNDAHVVADLFHQAMSEFTLDRKTLNDCFSRIDFAVLDHSKNHYNFNEFNRAFGGGAK